MKCTRLLQLLLAIFAFTRLGWTQTASTVLSASSSSPAAASSSSAAPVPPPAPALAVAGSSLKITVSWRGRAEAWDWFSTPATEGHYGFGASLLRVGIGQDMPKDDTLATLKRERIAHRLIGNFGFSHVQRSFDGMHFVFDTKNSNTTFFAGRPTQGVFDTNGLRELNVDVLYGAHTHAFGGK